MRSLPILLLSSALVLALLVQLMDTAPPPPPPVAPYADRYPPDLEKRKACLENCADNAINPLVVVVCQRGCEPVDWR